MKADEPTCGRELFADCKALPIPQTWGACRHQAWATVFRGLDLHGRSVQTGQ